MRRCCVSLIAKPCANTMLPGRTPWRWQLPRRQATFSNISIPIPHWRLRSFAYAAARFKERDLRDGAFAQFADVETLWRHNTFSVGKDLARARPGDLLFFRQDSAARMPFHAMIFLGHSQVEPDSEQFVVYHTGPSGSSRAKFAVYRLRNC